MNSWRQILLAYLAQDGDRINVFSTKYPHLNLMDEPSKEAFIRKTGFILDNHLGKLASYLRMLGFDTLYRNDYQDDELATSACQTQRILLTRDRGLLMRREIEYGHCIRWKGSHYERMQNLINAIKAQK